MMKKGGRSRNRGLAYHEAGHAVASCYIAQGVLSVTIQGGAKSACAKVETWFNLSESDELQIEKARRAVICLLAGPIAEERAIGVRPTNYFAHYETAEERVAFCCDPGTDDDFDETAELRGLETHAEALLARQDVWADIERVANALLQRKTLTGDHVRALVHGAAL